MIIETERLILRETTPEDAENMLRLHSNLEVQKYTGDEIITSLKVMKEKIIEKEAEYKRVGFGRWTTILKEGNQFVGWAGLKYLEEFKQVDLGYRFLPQYWNKGIGTEASKAILKYGFEKLNLEEIIAVAIEENIGSIKIMQKIGMKFDKYAPYDPCGEDVVWYKLEKNEFQSK